MAISNEKLPRCISNEKSCLGAMIVSRFALSEGLAGLESNDFFDVKNKLIFNAIVNLYEKKNKVDIALLQEELTNLKILDKVGGIDYLFELTQLFISQDYIKQDIEIIKENSNLRNVLTAMNSLENEYLNNQINGKKEFVGKIQSTINTITSQRSLSEFLDSKEITQKLEENVIEARNNKSEKGFKGLNTGYDKLNFYLNGLQKQNLIVVAARTGVGKTAFALNLALNVSLLEKKTVGIFEMEMPATSLYTRLVSNLSNVNSYKIMNGTLTDEEMTMFRVANKTLSEQKIYVDESSSLTLYDLIAKSRRLKEEHPDLCLIVIDYLGLIASDNSKKGKRYESRQLEIQEYTRQLHELARELDVPIVLLCQLNRNSEDRTGSKVPKLSDLRESGSIEQDAEIVLLLHREDYGCNELNKDAKQYKKATAANMSPEARKDLEKNAEMNVAKQNGQDTKAIENKYNEETYLYVIVAKNRNGQSDKTVMLKFKKNISKFEIVPPAVEEKIKKFNTMYSD